MKPQHQIFVKEYIAGKSAGAAYAKAYDRPLDKTSYNNGSKLLANTGIAQTLEELERQMPAKAAEAFQDYVNLAKDPKTPANVKERIYARIMALGGMSETRKVELDDKRDFKGLNLDEVLQSVGYSKD